jgi:outer membrane assembly lipoprotein YfiO
MMKRTAALSMLLLAAAGCGRTVSDTRPDKAGMEAAAEAAMEGSAWHDAEVLYTQLLFDYPGATDTDSYLYGLSVACAEQKLWAEAEFNLGRILQEYPRSPLADDSRLELASIYWSQRRDYRRDQTQVLAALDELVTFQDDYPGSDLLDEALLLGDSCRTQLARRSLFVGRFYARRDLVDAALLYYREALDDYGGLGCRGQILLSMGEIYAETGNVYAARTNIERALAEPDLDDEDREKASSLLTELENR